MARIIVITSGKGGAGKTTICANLGLALARKNLRVLLMDLDIGLNNLDVVMNVEDKVVYDLIDVVENRCRPSQAFIQDDEEPTLYVMPSCKIAKRQVSSDAVKKVIRRVSDSFDYVLVDCPAGLDVGFRRAVNCANEAIVVVTPHLSGVRDADKTIAELNAQDISVNVVVNRVRGDLVAGGEMLSAFEVFSVLGQTSLGIIPESDDVNCNLRLHAKRKAFDVLADNLHNGTFDMYDCVSRYNGLLGRWRRKLKKNV